MKAKGKNENDTEMERIINMDFKDEELTAEQVKQQVKQIEKHQEIILMEIEKEEYEIFGSIKNIDRIKICRLWTFFYEKESVRIALNKELTKLFTLSLCDDIKKNLEESKSKSNEEIDKEITKILNDECPELKGFSGM